VVEWSGWVGGICVWWWGRAQIYNYMPGATLSVKEGVSVWGRRGVEGLVV